MTYAPPTLVELGRYWTQHGDVNLGIVGDTRHQAKGTSYHLGRSQLTPDAYSRKTHRDRAGLSDAASAIDLGKLNGNLGQLRAFSVWLVKQCQSNAPGTQDIREVIYSPDGKTVLRWDRERGVNSAPRPGEADNSHLGHSHVSWYRDSEKRPKVAAFRPYFLPDTSTQPEEEQVIIVTIETFAAPRKVTAKTDLRRFTASAELSPIEAPYEATVDGTVTIESSGVPHGAGFLRLASGGSAGKYILAAQVDLA